MAGKSSFKLGKHHRRIVSSLTGAIVAHAAGPDEKPDEQAVLKGVEEFISCLPLLHRVGLLLLLSALEFMPLISGYWRRFSSLSRSEQTSFLNRLENSRFYACRAIGLAVKCTVVVNYFAQPEVERALGYTHACLIEHPGGGRQ